MLIDIIIIISTKKWAISIGFGPTSLKNEFAYADNKIIATKHSVANHHSQVLGVNPYQ